jgi:GxxExxY protein
MKDYLNNLSKEVIGAAIEVHRDLGPGLLESTYEASLQHELELRGIASQRQLLLPIHYKDLLIPDAYRMDLLVEDSLVVELKTVQSLLPVQSADVFENVRKASGTSHQFSYRPARRRNQTFRPQFSRIILPLRPSAAFAPLR